MCPWRETSFSICLPVAHLYTTTNRTLDNDRYNDSAHWEALNRKWYSSGAAYRDLPRLDGAPNPIFLRWLAHPAYDDYWRK